MLAVTSMLARAQGMMAGPLTPTVAATLWTQVGRMEEMEEMEERAMRERPLLTPAHSPTAGPTLARSIPWPRFLQGGS